MSGPAADWELDMAFPVDYVLLPLDLLDGQDESAAAAGEAALLDAVRSRLNQGDPRLSATPEELLPLLWAFTLDAWEFGATRAAVQVIDLPDCRYGACVRVYNEELTGAAAERPGKAAKQAKILARQLREPHAGDVSSRVVQVVDLPGGVAVRVSYRADDEGGAQAPGSASVVLEVLEHWFPVPGQPRALVVEGRTSFLADAGGMVADLDRIAASVRLLPP